MPEIVKKWSKNEEAKLIELYNEGLRLKEIAEQLGRTKASISHRINLLKQVKELKRRNYKTDLNSVYYNRAMREIEKFRKGVARFAEFKRLNPENYSLLARYDDRNFADGLTPSTREGILSDLDLFGRYLRDKSFLELGVSDVEDYFREFRERGNDPKIKKSRTKEFYKYLVEQYPKNDKLMSVYLYLSRKRRGRQKNHSETEVKERLTRKEIVRLVAAIKGKDFFSVRDRAILAGLYDSGCRCSEYVAIRSKDGKIDGKYPHFFVPLSKTFERDSPLLDFSLPYLMEYLKAHEFLDNPDAPFFYSRSTMNYGEALTTTMIANIIKRAARIAKLKKNVSPHILRDSKITHVAQEGNTTPAEANMLFGWGRSSGMFNYYSTVTSEELRKRELERQGKLAREEMIEREEERRAFRTIKCKRCSAKILPDEAVCRVCGLARNAVMSQAELDKDKELKVLRAEMENMQNQMAEFLVREKKPTKEEIISAIERKRRKLI